MPESKTSNHLINEQSLYLQQHAHNPVHWYPWSDEAWEKAKKENKLVLVSIGYSSCHWCHVMEKETFEDSSVAEIMNANYVCIKVDREERPDIDQVYMNAVQLMTGGGGWPLNCFTLPDGSPIYGGTYFPQSAWKQVLIKLKEFYDSDPVKAKEYSLELLEGIRRSEIIPLIKNDMVFSRDTLTKAIEKWKTTLDSIEGGPARAPKFPLPGNYQFLLRYAVTTKDYPLIDHVRLTLNKMAFGGIYDQLAGGFARYSVDSLWKVPHFEKMLYDNAQLISLYSLAYKFTRDELYKQVAVETINFLRDEMSDGNGGYFSAFDADSEGEEGKYYVWTKEEISNTPLPKCGNADGQSVFADYFNINEHGYWEKNHFILLRKKTDDEIANKYNVSLKDLNNFIAESKRILRDKRSKRIPPALDKKIITSWNALQITALCNAWQAFGDERYRKDAITCAEQILKHAVNKKGMLLHVRYQKDKIESGFLEDYAFMITALINLYQITFDEKWLHQSKKFADDAIEYFYDHDNGFFWFTPESISGLVTRKKETIDNVIPSSNSEMANALFLLGDYFDEKKYSELAGELLSSVESSIVSYPPSFSNWANLLMNYAYPFNEVVIIGDHSAEFFKTIAGNYYPHVLYAGTERQTDFIPLFDNRFQEGKTLIYICSNKTCKLPVESTSAAIELLSKSIDFSMQNVNY